MCSVSALRPFRNVGVLTLLSLLVFGSACDRNIDQNAPVAYVAPASVNLREQLNQKNSTTAVLKHGERVSVIDVRRRFVKVRTGKGSEGWIDSYDLLNAQDMQRIQQERSTGLRLPSEGTATAYETLNIHLDPNRRSPAFTQIPEGGAVSVLEYTTAPKTSAISKPTFVFDRPKPITRKQRRERQARSSSKQPPMPPAPKPPSNWETQWGVETHSNEDESASEEAKQDAGTKKPVVRETWALVRTQQSKQVGWVLARNLMMSVPDEVAQYAEGRHITSYFELGTVNDEESGQKHDWLWTTASGIQPYDFDSWRVFLWNRRRHRYETSYRQRDLEGYFPVIVDPPDPAFQGRTFNLITKDDDGQMRRRTYVFDGSRVHLRGTENYSRIEPGKRAEQGPFDSSTFQKNAKKNGWFKRQWDLLMKRLGRGKP